MCAADRRRTVRRLYRIGLLLLLLMAVAFGALWYLPRMAPSWYSPPDIGDEEVIALASTVESRFIEEMHLIRAEPKPWAIRIREHQINAWLAVRLRSWVEHDRQASWPSSLRMVQAHFEEGHVSFAMDFREHGARQVVTARFAPFIESGRLRLMLDKVLVGRIAITGDPLNFLLSFLDDQANSSELDTSESVMSQTKRLIRGEETLPAQLALADGRVVVIDALVVRQGAIEMTSRTQFHP